MKRDNRFGEFRLRSERAAGRALIGMGMVMAVETKALTHRISGTLARSVHMAPVRYDGTDDAVAAANRDMLADEIPIPERIAEGQAIEVGSWLPYACVEWIGRGHPGITQGLESVRGERSAAIVHEAFRQEGL